MSRLSVVGRGSASALAVALVGAVGVTVGGASPAFAAGISQPPAAPHSVIVFPVRDFVSVGGLTAGQNYVIEDWRAGVRVGVSAAIPVDRLSGLVEVNHPGGGCWVGVTPDVRAGDRVVVHPENDATTGDATTTADVVVTQPATKIDATTVTVKGTAADATGAPLPIGAVEARLVANKQAFVVSGKRTLRAPGDGVISYDAPGSTSWTATFSGLGGVNPADGLSDADRAVANESRGLWLGTNPGTLAEVTIYEFGQIGGPAPPCTAPLATGPSTPDLTPATDTGASNADNITSNPTPAFTGVLGNLSATSVNLYVDGILAGSTSAFGPGGTFTVSAAAAIGDGAHSVKAGEVSGGVETLSAGALSVTVDTTAPVAPAVTGTVPATTGSSTSPAVRGTAEAGSTVQVYGDPSCTPAALGTGSAADFASTGVSAPVATGSASNFYAHATDLAGNVSPCSTTSAGYRQDSVAPADPTIDAASTTGLVATTTANLTFADSEAGVTFQCSLDGAAFTPCTSPQAYSALGQGAHSAAVRAVDAAGNVSNAATNGWTVDTVAPTTTITSPVGATINDPSPIFHFNASEAGSSYACSLDGSPAAACVDGQTYGTAADGAHTFRVTATDPAGNVGPTAAYGFTIDTAVPPVGIDGTPPNPTNVNTPTFTYSSPKAGVTFSCALALSTAVSPAFAACPGGSFTAPARADGVYTFTVRATDQAGNVGSASTSLTIDTTAPAAPSLTSKPAATSSVTTPVFGFTAEPGASFLCSLTPGVAQGPCASGEQYGPLAAGTYTFKVLAKDAAGNIGAPVNYTFVVDTAAPPVSITSGPTGITTSRAPSFGFSSTEAGATFQCALSPDQPAFTPCTSPMAYAGLADGSYSFGVRALDAAGNVSTAATRSFTVDATAPTVALVTKPTNPTRDASPVFSYSTSETANGSCSLVLAGAADAFSPCPSTTSYSALADGSYRFAVKATDLAGNVSAVVSYPFTVTTAADPLPTVTARTPAAGATGIGQAANLSATFSEPVTGVGPTTFTLRTGGATGPAVTATSVSYNATTRVATFNPGVTLAADTQYTATLTAGIKDAAGQGMVPTSWTFTTGPRPTVTAKSPAAAATGVSRSTNVTATFSEAVAGVSATSFTLKTATGAAVTASVTYNATTRVATLNPGAASSTFVLTANTRYTARLAGITDAAGNALAATTWSFTTGP